jgi:hypothetical protein
MDLNSWTRREFVVRCGLVGVSAIMPVDTANGTTERASLTADAFIWGLPVVLFNRWVQIAIEAGIPFNRFFLNSELATPSFKSPGPNIDTLYGFAYLDLSDGPQIIGVPDTHDRYYSIQLQDAWLNTFDYIGRRTTGTEAGHFAITPPGFAGSLPKGVTEVRATITKVFAFVRTFIGGPEDMAAARAIQTAFSLGASSQFPDGRHCAELRDDVTRLFPFIDPSNDGPRFFEELRQLIKVYPPLDADAANLARFAPLGLGGPKLTATADELVAGALSGYDQVKHAIRLTQPNGWMRRANVPNFYTDPVQRAANNYFAFATLVAEEGCYFGTRQGGLGSWLDGANRYRLRFAAGQLPPVSAFWSLTLYNQAYALHDNSINRYGILDRTHGLHFGADGSLEIQVQADEPAEGSANWLPAPRDHFQLVLRAYQPHQSILDGTYSPPPIENLGNT